MSTRAFGKPLLACSASHRQVFWFVLSLPEIFDKTVSRRAESWGAKIEARIPNTILAMNWPRMTLSICLCNPLQKLLETTTGSTIELPSKTSTADKWNDDEAIEFARETKSLSTFSMWILLVWRSSWRFRKVGFGGITLSPLTVSVLGMQKPWTPL